MLRSLKVTLVACAVMMLVVASGWAFFTIPALEASRAAYERNVVVCGEPLIHDADCLRKAREVNYDRTIVIIGITMLLSIALVIIIVNVILKQSTDDAENTIKSTTWLSK